MNADENEPHGLATDADGSGEIASL